jgi:hypothetical protein
LPSGATYGFALATGVALCQSPIANYLACCAHGCEHWLLLVIITMQSCTPSFTFAFEEGGCVFFVETQHAVKCLGGPHRPSVFRRLPSSRLSRSTITSGEQGLIKSADNDCGTWLGVDWNLMFAWDACSINSWN